MYAGSSISVSISVERLLLRPRKGAHCDVAQLELIQFPVGQVQPTQ